MENSLISAWSILINEPTFLHHNINPKLIHVSTHCFVCGFTLGEGVKILDLTAGNRAVWFNKKNPLCTFIDIRPEVEPDFVMDAKNLHAFKSGIFDLIVFDPPHVNFGKNGKMAKNYGHFTTEQIRDLIKGASKEAHRVAKKNGLMAFKWNSHDQKLPTVLKMMSEYWEPLFGHLTKDGPRSQTYWCILKRI